jgi:hypothetical protein
MKMKIIICLLTFSFFLLVVAGSNVPSSHLSLDVNNDVCSNDITYLIKNVQQLTIGVSLGLPLLFCMPIVNSILIYRWAKAAPA